MKAIIRNQTIVFGPSGWNPDEFSRQLNRVSGLSVSLPEGEPDSAIPLDGVAIVPVIEAAAPAYDPATQAVTPNYVVDGAVVRQSWAVTAP